MNQLLEKSVAFTDNPAVRGQEMRYRSVTVDVRAVLESWRQSLFAHEWLTPSGAIRDMKDLPEAERAKRGLVEEKIEKGETFERPVLGIGMLDNVEIGSGRAIFLTLASRGIRAMTVHVPASQLDEFSAFMACRDAGRDRE